MNDQPSTDIGVLVPVDVHFDDLDLMGMLHNSRYQVRVERAWVEFCRGQGFGHRRLSGVFRRGQDHARARYSHRRSSRQQHVAARAVVRPSS
ncbi:hypothetical protein GCM10025734_14500 [Kitasatospora paranensis]